MKTFSGILTVLLVTAVAAAAGQGLENAAFYYWKAVGLMRPPRTQEQLEALQFVEEELPLLSPRIFDARPAVLNWLLSEQALRDVLRDASVCAECDFGTRLRGGPFLDLSHLPRLSALCRLVCAMAQALEYAGRPEEAAQTYVGLLRMIRWLDMDRAPASSLAAADMMQTVLWSMESFLGGGPPPGSLVPLADFFRKAGGPPFHPADYLRDESERVAEWLRQDGQAAVEQMRRRVGTGPLAPALERAAAAAVDEDRSAFENWMAEYRSRMDLLAEAMEKPFAEGAPILARLDAERAGLLKDPGAAPDPLVILLVPAAAELHQRLLLADAQWDMAALLCVAAERQARTGNWPAVTKDLAKRLGRAFPLDPFSGEAMHYQLVKGQPVLGVRIPRAMAESGRWMYTLDVAERARRDAERTREAIRRARAIEFRELFEPAAP